LETGKKSIYLCSPKKRERFYNYWSKI